MTINEYIYRKMNPQKTSSSFVPLGVCELEDKTRAGDRRGRGVSWRRGTTLAGAYGRFWQKWISEPRDR